MTDLESRIKSQLLNQSQSLPALPFGSDTALNYGKRRKRRSLTILSVGGLAILAGLTFGAGPVWASLFDSGLNRAETVVADSPQPTRPPGQVDDSVLDVEVTATTTTETTPATTTIDETGVSTAGQADETQVRTSMDEAVGRLAPDSMLFHSDNEGCDDLPDGRAHPAWIEGQPGTEFNEDGTPTYGFAFNTGDSIDGEIDWRFVQQSGAPSGDCVVSMTLNQANDSSHAVRLFRRYDRDGKQLPEDAYYSVWLFFPEVIEYDLSGIIDGEEVFGFWRVFQIKNDLASDDGRQSLSALSFNAGKLSNEDFMSLSVHSKVPCSALEGCDQAFTVEQADPIPIPTGQWVHFELHLLARSDQTGSFEVWQNGQKILRYDGQTERQDTVRRTWSLNSAGQLHNTASHSLFADDPLISTEPIYAELFGS